MYVANCIISTMLDFTMHLSIQYIHIINAFIYTAYVIRVMGQQKPIPSGFRYTLDRSLI